MSLLKIDTEFKEKEIQVDIYIRYIFEKDLNVLKVEGIGSDEESALFDAYLNLKKCTEDLYDYLKERFGKEPEEK